MTGSLEELALAREQAWIATHGKHEYDQHDLIAEAKEELADAYNYANHLPWGLWEGRRSFLNDLESAWEGLSLLERRMAEVGAAKGGTHVRTP